MLSRHWRCSCGQDISLCPHGAYLLIGHTKKFDSSHGQFKKLLKVFKARDQFMLFAFLKDCSSYNVEGGLEGVSMKTER